ncbi:4-phosphoerythronate dehydrogenase [Alteromonas sp. BMJM2]|uniref:4-phosphoerythronate dehydrogenase n=1 Tax=Alteromonas sp. BMJM2 TaxID=2954241 RepID=UPI0022B3C9CB|nr:4-phosphoerythronate dehydrogenase [Alteromonas sp. BMJM2]
MKILLEDTIPFGESYLHNVGEVSTYAWQNLAASDLADIDILALRSTTKVTPELLKDANKLQFVTTATAGTNHIDKACLDANNIAHSSAAGCNAVAVAEYVLSVLLHAQKSKKLDLYSATVGIVGAGNVGTALSVLLDAIGVRYKLCDPPLQEAGDKRAFVGMDDIAGCDVITLHVPFVRGGPYPTGNLIDSTFLRLLNDHQLLINACRGEVIDELALHARLASPNAPTVVLDVFNNEPAIDTRLFECCWFVTPHIAGHSVEGKVRGTQMIYEQICHRTGQKATKTLSDFLQSIPPIRVALQHPTATCLSVEDLIDVFHRIYDISIDDKDMRQSLEKVQMANDNAQSENVSAHFAALRKQYRVRRECSAHILIVPNNTSKEIMKTFECLGFSIQLEQE